MALTLLVILAVPAAVVLCSPFAAGLTYVVAGSTATVYASLYGPRIAWVTAAATTLLVLLVEASKPSPIAAVVLMVVVGLVMVRAPSGGGIRSRSSPRAGPPRSSCRRPSRFLCSGR